MSILKGRRTFTQQLTNVGRKVSKTINSRYIPRSDHEGIHVVAGVSRLIRVAVAGLTSLALAIGLLLCLVLWHDKR